MNSPHRRAPCTLLRATGWFGCNIGREWWNAGATYNAGVQGKTRISQVKRPW